jgi:hypothetical protein
MKRPLLINLALLLLVAVLAVAVWLAPEEQPAEPPPLTNLDPAGIRHLRLHNRHGELELQREDTGWEMVQPYPVPANSPRVELLLGIATAKSLGQFPVPADRLTEFGLNPPLATLELDRTRIEVGGIDPLHHRRYLRIGNTLHLITDRFPQHLLATPEEFVAPELLPTGKKLIAIRTPGWRLTQEKDGTLTLEPPQPGLSMDDLNRKFDQWRSARAIAVLPAPAGSGDREIELLLADSPQPLRFQMQKREKELLLVRPDLGLAYRLPDGSNLLDPPRTNDTP